MSDEDLVNKILYEIYCQLEDSEVGYDAVRSEYWFGRLCSSEELKTKIMYLLDEHRGG